MRAMATREESAMNYSTAASAAWYLNPARRCVDTPEAWWFPTIRASRSRTARVAAMCLNCPVRAQCAADARACDDGFGIRAGVHLSHLDPVTRRRALAVIANSPDARAEPIVLAPLDSVKPSQNECSDGFGHASPA